MTIRVLLFGHYRDAVPGGAATLSLPAPATPEGVAGALAERDPRLCDLLARTRVAVNAEFAPTDASLADGDEVAFLPPMSGG
jgi:molybdopterin synthase sulfur carrier subunit